MLRMSCMDIKLLEEKAKMDDENARRANSIVHKNSHKRPSTMGFSKDRY